MKPNPVKTEVAAVVAQAAATVEVVVQVGGDMVAAVVAQAEVVMEVVAADVVATKPSSTSNQQNSPRRE